MPEKRYKVRRFYYTGGGLQRKKQWIRWLIKLNSMYNDLRHMIECGIGLHGLEWTSHKDRDLMQNRKKKAHS